MGIVGAPPLSNKMSFLYCVKNPIYLICLRTYIENEKLAEIFANLKLNPMSVTYNCYYLH